MIMYSWCSPIGPGGLPDGLLTPLLHDIVQLFLPIEFLGVLLTSATVKTFVLIVDSTIIQYKVYKTHQSYVSRPYVPIKHLWGTCRAGCSGKQNHGQQDSLGEVRGFDILRFHGVNLFWEVLLFPSLSSPAGLLFPQNLARLFVHARFSVGRQELSRWKPASLLKKYCSSSFT